MFKYNTEIMKIQEMFDPYFNGDKNLKEIMPSIDHVMTEKDRALFTYLFFTGKKEIIVDGKAVNYRTKLTHLPDSLLQEEMYDIYSNLWGLAYEQSGDFVETSRHMEKTSTAAEINENLNKKACDL